MSKEQLLHFYSELSSRKKDILYWVSQGLSNREIGQQLYISTQVVAEHLTDIYADFAYVCGLEGPITRYHLVRYYASFFDDNPHLSRDARSA